MESFRDQVRDFETSSKFHGCRNPRRAAILYLVSMGGGCEGTAGDVESIGYHCLIGRHILVEDNLGFVSFETFSSSEEALAALDRVANFWISEEDSECLGHPAGPYDPMGETVYCDGSCQT